MRVYETIRRADEIYYPSVVWMGQTAACKSYTTLNSLFNSSAILSDVRLLVNEGMG